jgi:hypothetical protein
MTDRTPHVVGINDEPLVHWLHDPVFKFETEVDALRMLEILGDELKVAREQVRHTTRYLAAAVQAARQVTEDDGRSPSRRSSAPAASPARPSTTSSANHDQRAYGWYVLLLRIPSCRNAFWIWSRRFFSDTTVPAT